MTLLKNHPALAGARVVDVWRRQRDERMRWLAENEARHSRAVQCWKRRRARERRLKFGRGFLAADEMFPKRPADYARRFCAMILYPLSIHASP
jgi:hypothetical protein